MVLGFDLGAGGRSGVVDVLLISFISYCTSLWTFWLCRCMYLFILSCSACSFYINSSLGECSDV